MTYTWHDIDGRMVELCDECGFDARELVGSEDEARRLDEAYAHLARLLQGADVNRRPATETWSALEYADHCIEVAEVMLGWVADLVQDGAREAMGDLGACRRAVAALVTVEWLLRHLLHDVEHHVLDVRRGYASLARAENPEVDFRERLLARPTGSGVPYLAASG